MLKRKSVKERAADERQVLLGLAKQACSNTSARTGPTGTVISEGTAFMLKNNEYFMLSLETKNRFEKRMKWSKI